MTTNQKTNSKASCLPLAHPRIDWVGRATAFAEQAFADKRSEKEDDDSGFRNNKWVRLAARRFLNDLKKQRQEDFPYYLCPFEAERACKFFSLLPHVEGNWESPTVVLEEWQVFIIVNIWGWRRVADGLRRFDKAYLALARKNGKSLFASGTGIYALACEKENGAQVVCGATTGSQARIVFDVASKMVQKTPKMIKAFKLEIFSKIILSHLNLGTFKPINSKASTQDGLNPHCIILDELHAHENRKLFDVLNSARGARRNPLSLFITTAGYNSMGICFEQQTVVQKILQEIVTLDNYFGIIFTLDEGDDPLEEDNWIKANPNLHVMNIKNLRDEAAEARVSPNSLHDFLTKRMNVWTTAPNAFININEWKKCDGPVNLEELLNEECWGGVDLASTADLAAFRLLWRIDKKLITWGRFYLPEAAIQIGIEKYGIPYRQWVDAGHIVSTPGNVTDYEFIENDINECLDRFNIKKIGFDPWNASDLTNRLMAGGAPIELVRQGAQSLNAPMKEIERAYLSHNLAHAGDPVLTWNASNLVARKDANQNYAPDKEKSVQKIDGMCALFNAAAMMLSDTEEQFVSVYEKRGLASAEI
jgi:phage terminase large subunit-like protein